MIISIAMRKAINVQITHTNYETAYLGIELGNLAWENAFFNGIICPGTDQ